MNVLYAYNESQMRKPFTHPIWKKWPKLLDTAHAQAEACSGFVGRYRGEEDVLGYIAPRWPMEELIMGNLSAWRDLESLRAYTFGRGAHGGMIRHRSKWFEPWPHFRPHFVAWWARADVAPNGAITPLFDLDTAMLMQSQLGQLGPDGGVFGWDGPP